MKFIVDEVKRNDMIKNGLHPSLKNIEVRTKAGTIKTVKNVNRKLAIKLMCTECMGWETNPEECTSKHCPLYSFRGRTLHSIK